MDLCCDVTTLVASPSYPNSICWSNDNLLAIASGHIITILNPGGLDGPRGLITLPQNEPFSIGLVSKEDFLSPCLMPTYLTRQTNPCARSISWSPPGFASNSGCLLAVCTVDGRVRLYRSPFCEYRSEWVQVDDISQILCEYLSSINFGEPSLQMVISHQPSTSCQKEESGKRKRKAFNKWEKFEEREYIQPCSSKDNASILDTSNKILEAEDSSPERTTNESTNKSTNSSPQISPNQYLLRSSQLSSLTVSWSPLLNSNSNSNFAKKSTILATGAKSGDISFWQICAPDSYSIDTSTISNAPKLIGLLNAHNSWITSINWGISPCKSKLLLATGSSDGSVKLWIANVEELNRITEPNKTPFSFLTEVAKPLSLPISIISLAVPIKSRDEVLIAIGRGSGLVESWIFNLSTNKLVSADTSHSLNQSVMSLAWAFEGRCLYACSQDSVRCWIFNENCLHETNFSSRIPGLDDSSDLSHLADQYFGLAISPGDMMLSLVHSLDTNLLNPMYQARTQKAMVQFFYTGGEILEISKEPLDSSNSLSSWESNILTSLQHFENYENTLVIWDIIKVLTAFKNPNPEFLNNLFTKWISRWFSDIQKDFKLDNFLSRVAQRISSIGTRKLQMLNIICRRIIFNNSKCGEESEMWNKVLARSELELRERLVCLTFNQVLNRVNGSCYIDTGLYPFGLDQMLQWVSDTTGESSDLTKKLASKIKTLRNSIESEEKCGYCSAPIKFENAEVAWCKGTGPHKFTRCAVSMQICSVLNPNWFCICCKRSINKLPPNNFFNNSNNILDNDSGHLASCPFCGIMLQREVPEFLLSFSPV